MRESTTATLNGRPLIELHIELQRGGSPSILRATLPPGEKLSGEPVLELADAETSRTFRQFRVARTETLGDGRVVVHGEDRRRDWQRPAHADINVPLGDGTGWREGEPLSAQRAVEKLFVAAGLGAGDAPVLPAAPQPVGVHARGMLGAALEALLESIGLTVTVDDAGELQVLPADAANEVDRSRLVRSVTTREELPGQVSITGGAPLQLVELTGWDCVIPDDDGKPRAIGEVLSEWGVSESAARQACLSDGGFEELLPKTGEHAAARLATLKRYAYRMFRASESALPWLPVGGLHTDGTFKPPQLEARVARPRGVAPKHPRDGSIEETQAEPIEAFELDADNGIVYLPQPPYGLVDPRGGVDDPTLQDRRLVGDPRLTLAVAVSAERPPFTHDASVGDGDEVLRVHAPHLVAVYDSGGALLNRAGLQKAASALAESYARKRLRRESTLAGVDASMACGTCERVTISADAGGLTTTLVEQPQPVGRRAVQAASPAKGRSGQPLPSGLHQPVNAFRGGPLVLRVQGETPEGESVLAVEALHRSSDTGALELKHPGSLAFPFFLESAEAVKFGRWFFVAGVEVADSGRLRVLGPDERHTEIPPQQLFEARHVAPHGLRGLIVSLGDEPVFVDSGPLVADARGSEPGSASSLVYDLDRSSLSERKRGGLQFLSVLVLSPSHKQEGARDGGWAPALNLREGDTANPEVAGRGLFAEGDGHALGRLTAKLQGGPVLADSGACSKHLYGVASDDDGLYRESAGHISTDAFFKVPGDPVHDAPLKFYPAEFAGGVPSWPPHEAQIKYDPAEIHPWNHKQREGRWKIQYRVPFLPEIPPTWKPPIGPPRNPVTGPPDEPVIPSPLFLPYDVQPAVSEYNLWAPSHDWVPAPSSREQERETTYPGPSIKSEGWAGEAGGEPDPSAGGGVMFLPPGTSMPDAQLDAGTRQTFVALHPEVVLAFGRPGFSAGRVHSGWAMQLAASGGHLELAARDIDASIPDGTAQGLHVSGHMQVGPNGASFGGTQALRLGEEDDEGIAFGDDVELFRDGASSLRTDGAFSVGGKLTVEGLIDPTGLELTPQSSNPGGTAANTLWMNNGDSRLYHGASRLALSSELPAGPVPISGGGTGATSADGAINELINNATLDATLSPSDELMLRTSLVGRKSRIEYLLATVAGLSQLTAVSDGHKLLVIDDSGVARYAKFEDLHPAGTNLVATVIPYTGGGYSGKTVSLTGVNRCHAVFIYRHDTSGIYSPRFAAPGGSTGTVTGRYMSGYAHTSLSLNAPAAGTAQTLTINETGADINGSGVAYRAIVIGTPT
ncbi:MAG: hypothetical protein KDB82_18570 [Planctomycetes bacterium]|nr:hypothetical protein [Planctomycetota bacterium]